MPGGALAAASYRASTKANRRLPTAVRGECEDSASVDILGLRTRPTLSGKITLEIAFGLLRSRIAADQIPEPRRVSDLYQMDQFVHQDVVDHPRRHSLQPIREPDRSSARRTRSPALLLVRHPVHRSRLGEAFERRGQIAVHQ